jgi:predicted Zn finger-like uncharacterized protein
MMLTRCPACQTVFRLRADQLRARHGEVRCGHCFNPFNALEQLIADPAAPQPSPVPGAAPADALLRTSTTHDSAPEPVPATAGEPDAPGYSSTNPEPLEPPPANDAPTAIGEPSIIPPAPAAVDADTATISEAPDTHTPGEQSRRDSALLSNLDFDIPDDIVGSDASLRAPDRTEPRLDEIDFSSFFEPDSASLQLPPAVDEHRSVSSPGMPDFPALTPHIDEREPNSVLLADEEFDRKANASPGIEASTTVTLPDVIRAERRASADTRIEPGETEHSDAHLTHADIHEYAPLVEPERLHSDNEVDSDPDLPEAPALDSQHLDAIYGKPSKASGRRRTLWGLAVGLLAGALAVQASYLFRQDLARVLPGLRPLLVSACERLGCEMPLPREAAQISIDTSDLQSEPGRPGRFVLHATVKNRADFLQAWPHLELTLTDENDSALVRKVFSPAEWVTGARIETGFAPRGDAAVRLAFDVTAVAPTGYRVYVFYP